VRFEAINVEPYYVIKNKKSLEALLSFEKDQHALKIPEFKIVKRVRGQEQVIIKKINSNMDVYNIFEEDLGELKSRIFKKIKNTSDNYDLAKPSQRDTSIDPTYEDQLLQGEAAWRNAEHVYRNAPKII
jgi:hypothetical protein